MRFKYLVVRWDDDYLFIVPSQINADEKNLIRRTIRHLVAVFLDGGENYFVHKSGKMIELSAEFIARTVMKYVREHDCQFWVEDGYNRGSDSYLVCFCGGGEVDTTRYLKEIPESFDGVLKKVAKSHSWWKQED